MNVTRHHHLAKYIPTGLMHNTHESA